MNQFDLYRLKGGDLAMILQSDAMATLGVRIAAPLRSTAEYRANHPYLSPDVALGEQSYRVALPLLAAVPEGEFDERLGNLSHLRDAIVRGIDLLFTGA